MIPIPFPFLSARLRRFRVIHAAVLLCIFVGVASAQTFQINSLSGNGAVVLNVEGTAGDDRGGIAVSGSQVFYSGDAATVRAARAGLTGLAGLGVTREGLVTDLRTETVYLLGNGTTPIAPHASGAAATITSLLALDGLTGVTNGTVITLSSSITVPSASNNGAAGVFAGWGRIVIHNGTRVYSIALPTGVVTDLGAQTVPTHTGSETWAYWGVAETIGGETYLAYVQDSSTIVRRRVSTGVVSTIATFSNLGDMASFTVVPALNRWYFHNESGGQFGSVSELLGYASATFTLPNEAPTISSQPAGQMIVNTETAAFSVSAIGTDPLRYQWRKDGVAVPNATNTAFTLASALVADSGSYTVVITNNYGAVTSAVAVLTVEPITADLFKITSLRTNNFFVVDPAGVAGDDRGGLVATDQKIFLRGDDAVGSFNLTNLGNGVRLGTVSGGVTNFFAYDSLVSDLRSQKAYVLDNGTTSLGISGGTVTRLVEINGADGVPTGVIVPLSTPIVLPGAGLYTANVGLFSGWGRIVLHNGTNAYSINPGTGAVTDFGPMARPTRTVSESWAYWGVAEYWGGSHYLVYAQDAQRIVRTRIPDGATTVISTFSNLNDLASLTVAPGLNRWYFHNESVNQFSTNINYGSEVLGYADATFLFQAAGTLVLAAGSVTVTEDSGSFTQAGFVTSAPAGTASYSLTSDNAVLFAAGPALTPAGLLSFTPAANVYGSASVTVTAVNGSGQTVGSGALVVTVTPVNDAPVVTLTTNNVVVLEDSGGATILAFAQFSPGPANESAQSVSVVTVTNDNPALFSAAPAISAAGTLTFTPAANAFGFATVTVFVQDNGGTLNGGVDTSAAQTFTITVTSVNDAPSLTFLTNSVVVLEDSGPASVVGFASFSPGPANEAGQGLAGYTVANNNSALFLAQPALAANGMLTFTPAANANGSATVTVIAQDDGGTANSGVDRTTNSFTVTVAAVNDAPGMVLATNTVVVLEDSGATTVVGFAGFSPGPANETGQSITNVTASNNNGALFSLAPTFALDGTLTFTPAANANGSAIVTVIAQDNGGTGNGGVDRTTNSFTVTVTAVNDAPTVTFASNTVVVLEDSGAASLTGFAVFSPGPANESAQSLVGYTLANNNSALFASPPALDNPGTLTFLPAANAVGSATVTVIAQDNGGTANGGVDRTTNSFTITITAVNHAPTITLSTNQVAVVEDSGAQTLPAFAAFSPGPANESGQTITSVSILAVTNAALFSVGPGIGTNGALTFTPAANANGTALVTFTVQDSGGTAQGGVDTSAAISFLISVSPVNDAPIISLVTNQVVVLEDSAGYSAVFATFGRGPANESAQSVTNLTTSNNNTALFGAQPVVALDGTLAFTPAANGNGSATVTVIAQDDGGTANGGADRATNIFTITVVAVNDRPVISVAGSVSVLEDSGTITSNAFVTVTSLGAADESGQTVTNYAVANTNSALFSTQPTVDLAGNLSFRPAANTSGMALVTVIAQDNGGTANGGVDTSLGLSFLITVTAVNDAPVVTLASNVVVLEDSGAASLAGFASFSPGPADESGQTLVGHVLANNNNGLFSTQPAIDAAGVLSFTPAPNANGAATVTVVSQDSGGTANSGVDKTTNTFTLTVVAVNDPPGLLFATNEFVVLEDSGAVTAAVFASWSPGPANEAGQTVTNVVISNDNPTLFAVPPAIGADGTLAFTPATNANGTAIVTVIAQDDGGTANGGGDRTTNSFTITVTAVNDAPGVSFSTNTVVVLEDSGPASLTGFATLAGGPANESGQAVTNVTTSTDNAALFAVPPSVSLAGVLSFTLATNANGSATVTVIAQDDGSVANDGVNRATNTFTINVTAVNDVPAFTLSAGTGLVTNLNAIGWGNSVYGQTLAPTIPTNLLAAAGGGYHTLLLNQGGSVTARGYNAYGQTDVPVGLSTVVAVAAGFHHSMALKQDGTVVAWGSPAYGQTNVPAGLTNVTAIAGGGQHSLALKSDGTIVAWGLNVNGEASVPNSLTNAVAIAAGFTHSLALKADGTVVAWGDNGYGQITVPAGLTNVVAIAGGHTHSLALKSDGTVVGWGYNPYGQATAPAGLVNVTAIAAGYDHSLALRSDGSVVAWGDDSQGQTNVVPGLVQVVAIAGGGFHSVAVYAGQPTGTVGITVLEDAGAQTRTGLAANITAGPANESGQSVSFLVANDNAALFSAPPAIAANGTLSFTAAPNANGTALVTVRALDDGGTANGGIDTSAPQFFTITVTAVNDPPVVTFATNHVVVLEDSGAASLAGFATFSPGPANETGQSLVSYTLSVDNPVIFSVLPALTTNGTLTFTPAPNAFQAALVTVIAQDSGGTANGGINRTTNVFAISIPEVNDPPQVTLLTNLVVVPPDSGAYSNGAFATFSAGPTNELGQFVTNVTVITVANPALFSIQPVVGTNGALTFSPASGAAGSSTVTFVAQDNGGTANGGQDRTTNAFTITLAAANVAPTVTFSTNLVVVLEDSGAVTRAGFASFSPGPASEASQLLLGYTVANDNNALFSVAPAINNAGTLSFTPATNANGSATVTVIAQDNGGTSGGGIDKTTNQFTFTLTPVNDAPTFGLSLLFNTNTVVGWGYNGSGGATNAAGPVTGVTAIAAGGEHSLALLPNGTVLGWGLNTSNQAAPPIGLNNVIAISAGAQHSLALRSDGTVVAWGSNFRGQCTIPAGLTNVVAISAAGDHSVALKSDRTVVAWGYNLNGESTVPAGLTNVAVIAAGDNHTAVLKTDGTIVVWGFGGNGEKNVPATATNVATIASGGHHVLALRNDGTVVAWGYNTVGQATVPAGLTNVVAISGGLGHSVALKSDGTVVVWGGNNVNQRTVPPGLAGVIKIAAGSVHTLALVGSSLVQISVAEDSGTYSQPGFATNIVAGPADESGQTVTFQVSNNNGGLFTSQPTIDASGTLSFTPAANANGAATVTVRAQDDGGTANGGVDLSVAQIFTVVITALNDAPTVTFSTNNLVRLEDSGPASIAGFATFSPGPNETGQALATYAVSNDATNLFSVQPALSAVGTLAFTPATNAAGIATVTVIAQDNGGTTGGGSDRVTNAFTLTITPVNDAPRITFATGLVVAVRDSVLTNFPAFLSLATGPTNESGQTLTLISVANDNPTLFASGGQPAFNGAGELSFQPEPGRVGSTIVTVIAQDDGGTANGGVDRATNTFTILVAATRVFVGSVAETVPGGSLTIPLNLAGAGTESGVAFTLNYDPNLFNLGGVSLGGAAGSASLLTNTLQSGSGRLGLLVKLPPGEVFAVGTNELAVVTLNVAGGAPATNSPLTFGSTPVVQEVTDGSAATVPFVAYVGGTARVTTAFTAVEGDVSPRPGGNGAVTVSDVVQIGRYAAGLDTVTNFGAGSEFQRADCAPLGTQGDGRISLADWVQASRFAAGLDTPGSPGGPTIQAAALGRAGVKLPAGNRVLRVSSGALVVGQTNTVRVQLDALGNEAGVGVTLGFDASVLTFVNATIGGGATGGSLLVNDVKAAAGKLGLMLKLSPGTVIAPGTHDLITLTFKVTASGGTAITVSGDSPVAREVVDATANAVGVSFVDGSFNLVLPVGLEAVGMERAADGSQRLVVRNSDGTAVTVAQTAKYQVHVTTNLGDAWKVLPNALIVENGVLKIVDPAASGAGLRLYKLVETP